VARYERLYRNGAYAPRQERERLARMVRRGGAPGAFWRGRSAEAAGPASRAAPSDVSGGQETLF